MMVRAAVFTGFAFTIACAPARDSYPLLAPEPSATSFAVAARWQPVAASRPVEPHAGASAQPGADSVREVAYTDPGELAEGVRDTAVRDPLRGTAAEVVDVAGE